MNKACIAKMAWSLHTGASDLWCEVVWNKYKRNNSPRDIIAKPYDSSFWKAIAKVWPVLQDVELWSVGDGQKIRAWSMAWFDREIKISETGIQIPIALQQAKVVDLVNEEGEWNHDLLDYWLLETIIRKIEAIPPPQMEAGEDCMLVELNDAGRMSVKSTTTRKQAICGGQKPSLTAQSRRYQGNYWRPKGVRKTSVGKFIDGLSRWKWKGRILWRPGSPVPSNGQKLTHWLATA
jgi:hypothetical protein